MADDGGTFESNGEEQEDYCAIARKPERGTVADNFLEFFHSYGYDCRRYFNLCVLDSNTVAFAAGNLIQFFNVEENKVWFKIGSTGTGIGHISKNPAFERVAVGANGENPLITIYSWPLMRIVAVLEGGTTKRYFHLTHSPDGLLLASQGGAPDYNISIWNWQESRIILQCKSYVQDVYNVTFSKYIPGQLTSSGTGHIKFWKMSRTFTGLKLKGEIGKFGNTEISDIIAIHPMPNETVISGCEWGNVLLWDESLIKLEARRKNKEAAHAGYVAQFEYINGELISVGSDGWIRFWFYETMDHADLSDGEQFLEIQPIYEFHIAEGKENAMLMSIKKQQANDPDKTTWYAQDGNGGLWLLDLCTSKGQHEQKRIFHCHAGPVIDMDASDWAPFVATLDPSGNLHIYNYAEKRLKLIHKFHDTGSRVIWLPCQVDKTGSTLVCAFQSGIVRLIAVPMKRIDNEETAKREDAKLLQVLKPHSLPINAMSLNASCNLLVTGSEDATIFAFSIRVDNDYPTILPIGYVKVPSPVTCTAWNPQEEATLLAGCLEGDCVEVKLPTAPQSYTTTSYELLKCKPASLKFASVKSSIEREAVRKKYEDEKEERRREKRKEMEQLMAENPHIVIDEETFLMDLDEKEMILPEIYIPEIPNKVFVAQYGVNGNVWLFMGGFDAGYVYEYPRPLSGKPRRDKPIGCRIMEHARNTEIRNFLYHDDKRYLLLGTQHGELHVIRLKTEDPLDFSDCWILPTHDYYNGHISKILFSYDKEMLLTCGHDGNVFSFKINEPRTGELEPIPKPLFSLSAPNSVEDIEDADHPSLEQVITRIEQNRIISVAEAKKRKILETIRGLSEEYAKITARNDELLRSQRISRLELDARIAEDLERQLKAHAALTQRKLHFQTEKSRLELQKLMDHFVTPITCLPFAVHGVLDESRAVHSLREPKLNADDISKRMEIMKLEDEKQQKTEAELQQRPSDDDASREKAILTAEEEIEKIKRQPEAKKIEYLEGLLAEDFSDLSSGLGLQINQMLSKYKEKKARLIERENEWEELRERKPDLAKSRAKDAAFLEKAKQTIGQFDLKMNAAFDLTRSKETASTKYRQLVNCRSKVHELREDFNSKLKSIALEKQKMQKEVAKLTESLKKIHAEIPLKSIKPLPRPPKLNLDAEFPERNLELGKYVSVSEMMEEVKRQRQSLTVDQSMDRSDLEYEVLYCDDKGSFQEERESLHAMVSSSKTLIEDHSSIAVDAIRSLNASDSIQTPWEREMKRGRMWRKIYEQDSILRHIEASYERLEKRLDELEEYRLDVVYRSTYMNLNLLTLYEEFIILKESEASERALQQKVRCKSNESAALLSKIQGTSVNVASREEEIRKLQARIKDLASEFGRTVADSKFHDFLLKIFKKKHTAARRQNGSLDTETQSSESSSEESDGTIDSEAEYIPFDENICPAGCDRELYETAFSAREKRFGYELRIREEQKEIETLQKELDADAKYLRVIESNLKSSKEELQSFMLEKQKKLNDVNVTVILKVSQLQHISDSNCTEDIHNCVVFDRKELANLYDRVGELQAETRELEETRKKSETHLKRIKHDCEYMEAENKRLEGEMKEKMIQKFGRDVSLISLYETILQRLIYDTKTDARGIMKSFAKDIKDAKLEYNRELAALESSIRENTEKLSLLTVLEREKLNVKKILEQPLLSQESMERMEGEYKADVEALESILYSKIQEKHSLRCDIESLKARDSKPFFR